MSVFGVRSISFEPLVVFTNNFRPMSAIMRQYVMLMFDQGQLKVKVKTLYDCQGQKLTLFPTLHIGY